MIFTRTVFLIASLTLSLFAQIDLNYQKPAEEIMKLANVDLPPTVRIDSKGEYLVQLGRDQYKSISELSQPEMRLAGLRINPKTNIYSRTTYYKSMSLLKVGDKKAMEVKGLPKKLRLANLSWSPNEEKVAFTHTSEKGVELWVVDIATAVATRLSADNLNANMGKPFTWYQDSKRLLVKIIPNDRKNFINKNEAIPTGPTISINEGKKAQNRTYQDLLKDKNDEFNFEQLAHAEIITVDLKGKIKPWKETNMYRGLEFSPDGNNVLVTSINRPFSYIVPYYRFPFTVNVFDLDGNKIKTVVEVPLMEELPKGFMSERTGRRDISWRNDKPATLYWSEVLDGGDPEKEAEYRDALYEWSLPFEDGPKFHIKVKGRIYDVLWANNNIAIVQDYWWNTRNTKNYLFNPSKSVQDPITIIDRNYQDRYGDPGEFVTQKNQYGRSVLEMTNGYLFLMGDGYSEDGIFPFVDQFNVESQKS